MKQEKKQSRRLSLGNGRVAVGKPRDRWQTSRPLSFTIVCGIEVGVVRHSTPSRPLSGFALQ